MYSGKVVVTSSEEVNIPCETIKLIKATTNRFNGDLFIESSVRPQEGRESCLPQMLINVDRTQRTIIPIINLSCQDIVIKQGEIVARGWPCTEVAMRTESVLNIKTKEYTELKFDEVSIGNIEKKFKEDLFKLLLEYRDCIAQSTKELGCAKSAEMIIKLRDEQAFYCRPYRMSLSEQEVVKGIVGELLDNGIIRESNSEFASPVVLVKKKDGDSRMCIDFRKLNSMTVRDNFPLPRIDDQVNRLQRGKYFTSLDLRSGYHQIPIAEESKPYTAFITPNGQYEYNRTPFGLTNAPRTFQRFMNKILCPVEDIASVYLDDVLLHAETIPNALVGIKKVLEIFRSEGVTLNLKKCSFLMTEITYLG